jgi:Zn-dependent peptidase ImmA (M78 family)
MSFGTNGNDLREVRANAFASHYLLPPKFLEKLPTPEKWTEQQIVDWANKMKVSTWAMSIALKESGLIDASEAAHMQQVRVPKELKSDPELGMNLSPNRQRIKLELLERGLSDHYAGLCFEAHQRGLISTGRLAEMLLVDESLLQEIAQLYGRSLSYGD